MWKKIGREWIVQFMRTNGPAYKIEHSAAVADVCLQIADSMTEGGLSVDKEVLSAGALMHDIGLARFPLESVRPSPAHCPVGGDMVRDMGFPEVVAECVECHEIWTKDLAEEVGFPRPVTRDFVPRSVEARLVAFTETTLAMIVTTKLDPWKNPDSIEAYCRWRMSDLNRQLKELFNSDRTLTWGHPMVQRRIEIWEEIKRYLKPEFITDDVRARYATAG